MFSGRAAPAGFVVPSGTRAHSPGIHSWVNGWAVPRGCREKGFRGGVACGRWSRWEKGPASVPPG